MNAVQHAETIGALHDYKIFAEKCAEEHGWAGHDKHGEPIGWLYNEVLKHKNLCANGRILINMYRMNERYMNQVLIVVSILLLVGGIGVGKFLL